MIVSARHAEYLPPDAPGVTVTDLWPPGEGPFYDFDEGADAFEAATGLTAQDGIDYSWERIIRIEGEPNDIGDWLTGLCTMLIVSPSGDDDTFDYWPSGCMLATAVAAELGDPWPERIRLAILTGLAGIDESIRPEIEERITC